MTTQYIVCRLCPVVLPMVAYYKCDNKAIEDSTWNAPIIDAKAKIFARQKDAKAYCDKMNDQLNNPVEENGHRYIDIAPYTDFVVIPIQKG